jgi:hypothetical protein
VIGWLAFCFLLIAYLGTGVTSRGSRGLRHIVVYGGDRDCDSRGGDSGGGNCSGGGGDHGGGRVTAATGVMTAAYLWHSTLWPPWIMAFAKSLDPTWS